MQHVPSSKTSLEKLIQFGLLPANKVHLKTIEKKQVPQNHKALFKKFEDYIRYRRYSENTLRVYVPMLKIFFQHMDYPLPQDITREDIIAFNTDYILKNNFSFKLPKPDDIDSQRGLFYIRATKGQGGKFISEPVKTVKRILQGIPAKNLFVQWPRFREIF